MSIVRKNRGNKIKLPTGITNSHAVVPRSLLVVKTTGRFENALGGPFAEIVCHFSLFLFHFRITSLALFHLTAPGVQFCVIRAYSRGYLLHLHQHARSHFRSRCAAHPHRTCHNPISSKRGSPNFLLLLLLRDLCSSGIRDEKKGRKREEREDRRVGKGVRSTLALFFRERRPAEPETK